jgi:hypothetical protein
MTRNQPGSSASGGTNAVLLLLLLLLVLFFWPSLGRGGKGREKKDNVPPGKGGRRQAAGLLGMFNLGMGAWSCLLREDAIWLTADGIYSSCGVDGDAWFFFTCWFLVGWLVGW